VQHHAGEADDDPSAVVVIAETGAMPEAFGAVPELVTLDDPAPVGPSATGSDGSREDPVCPRAVAAGTISKTAQATTVMTRRRGDFPPSSSQAAISLLELFHDLYRQLGIG
jgi:hypothetical protein